MYVYMYMVCVCVCECICLYTYLYKMTFKGRFFQNEFYSFQPSYTEYSEEKYEQIFSRLWGFWGSLCLHYVTPSWKDFELVSLSMDFGGGGGGVSFLHFLQMSTCLSWATSLFHFL